MAFMLSYPGSNIVSNVAQLSKIKNTHKFVSVFDLRKQTTLLSTDNWKLHCKSKSAEGMSI